MKRRNLVNPPPRGEALARCLYGVHAVSAWLEACPAHVRMLYCDAAALERTAAIRRQAADAGVRVRLAASETLAGLAPGARHQGVVAECAPYPYASLVQVVARQPRLLVFADHLQDPHNLGAVLRTAEAVGAGAVVVPKDGGVAVTPAVEVAAAGAAAYLPVCRVTNTSRALGDLKEAGYWTVGLVPRDGTNLFGFEPPERVVVVLGGETGMRTLVARQCDFRITIPMLGRVESLNASVAAAVVLYQVRRHFLTAGTPGGVEPRS